MTWIWGRWTACGMSVHNVVEKSVIWKYQGRQDIHWIFPSLGPKGLIPQSLVSPGTAWFADPSRCEGVQKNHSSSMLPFLRQPLRARLEGDQTGLGFTRCGCCVLPLFSKHVAEDGHVIIKTLSEADGEMLPRNSVPMYLYIVTVSYNEVEDSYSVLSSR